VGSVDRDDEFAGFVRGHAPRLIRSAWLLVGEWPAAEDLVQTALERTWPRWAKLADDGQRLAYVHRVITRSYLRGRRRKWTGEIPTDKLPQLAVPDELDPAEMHAELIGAIRKLPPRQRAVIALRYLADLTEAQTAVAMHCSLGTVTKYASRAVAALRTDARLAELFAQENTYTARASTPPYLVSSACRATTVRAERSDTSWATREHGGDRHHGLLISESGRVRPARCPPR
jgi:RNA polymerase sigma-70 factor (sigma-E family)